MELFQILKAANNLVQVGKFVASYFGNQPQGEASNCRVLNKHNANLCNQFSVKFYKLTNKDHNKDLIH